MSLSHQATLRTSILAIVVIYKRSPSESRSLCSLVDVLNANPDLAEYFSLIVYDNSPYRQSFDMDVNVQVMYKHDPTNAGLATAYNFALALAQQKHNEWLLLLDQDTSPTVGFLTELVACGNKLRSEENVASMVPRLLVGGRVHSPMTDFIDQIRYQFSVIGHIRHKFRRTNHAVGPEVEGVQQRRLIAYNSGATLRVSALHAIGGFPKEFWLDFLDHAVFHALSLQGYKMYIMKSVIEHEGSQLTVSAVPAWRQRNILFAQIRFVKHYGNLLDRWLYRVYILRYSRTLWIEYPDRRLWKEAAWQALRFETRTERPPGDEGKTHDH